MDSFPKWKLKKSLLPMILKYLPKFRELSDSNEFFSIYYAILFLNELINYMQNKLFKKKILFWEWGESTHIFVISFVLLNLLGVCERKIAKCYCYFSKKKKNALYGMGRIFPGYRVTSFVQIHAEIPTSPVCFLAPPLFISTGSALFPSPHGVFIFILSSLSLSGKAS